MLISAIQDVVLPLIVALAIGGLFFVALRRRNGGKAPWFELGAFYVAVVLLYTVLPMIAYVVRESIGGLATDDSRFSTAPMTGPEVFTIGWWHVVYLACFAGAYIVARGKIPSERQVVLNPGATTIQVLLIYFLLSQGCRLLVGLYYNISAESYLESYIVERELPLIPRYVVSHANLTGASLKLLLLAAAFSNWKRYSWFIFGLLFYAVCNSFLALQSRTEMAMLLVAAGILYHRTVRSFSLAKLVVWGTVSLSVLLLFGIMRSERDLGPQELRFAMTTSAGEFECVQANGIDLLRKRDAGMIEPLSFHDLYLSPFTLIIPQPLLPFEKFSFSTWYMMTFFPASYEQGGGLAFGAIPEAIVGTGWPDLVWRAIALGVIFAVIHRYYVGHKGGFWLDTFYLWLLLFCYQSFRDVSFSMVYLTLHRFLLVWLVVYIFTDLIKGRKWLPKGVGRAKNTGLVNSKFEPT